MIDSSTCQSTEYSVLRLLLVRSTRCWNAGRMMAAVCPAPASGGGVLKCSSFMEVGPCANDCAELDDCSKEHLLNNCALTAR